MAGKHQPSHSEADHGKDSKDPKAVKNSFSIGFLARDGKYDGSQKGEKEGGGEVRNGHFAVQFCHGPKGRKTAVVVLALFACGDVVGIQHAQDVQQSSHQQKFSPVISHRRGHHFLMKSKKPGTQEEQA